MLHRGRLPAWHPPMCWTDGGPFYGARRYGTEEEYRASVAQTAEQAALNREVAGSSPARGTTAGETD